MKLYDVPKGSKIRLPISRLTGESIEECTFHHIDGMYSYIETPTQDVVHLAAATEVMLGTDGVYRLPDEIIIK